MYSTYVIGVSHVGWGVLVVQVGSQGRQVRCGRSVSRLGRRLGPKRKLLTWL